VRKEEEGELLLGAMLRQMELAFIKALGTVKDWSFSLLVSISAQ
jgi:hypothetical protein